VQQIWPIDRIATVFFMGSASCNLLHVVVAVAIRLQKGSQVLATRLCFRKVATIISVAVGLELIHFQKWSCNLWQSQFPQIKEPSQSFAISVLSSR